MVDPTFAIGAIAVLFAVVLVGVSVTRFHGSGSSATDLSSVEADDDRPGALAAAAEDLSEETDETRD